MYRLRESPRIQNVEYQLGKPIEKILYNLHWRNDLKHSEIGEKIDVPRSTVTKWFKHFGIPTQSCTRFTNLNLEKYRRWLQENKKPKIKKEFPWHFNKDFFKIWSPEMAYVFGFLIADGYIFVNPYGSCYFGFVSADKEIIEKIRNLLGSNHKIGIRKRSLEHPKWKDVYVLQIGSKHIFQYLKKLGIVQNKSLVIKFPKNIPNELLRHFVRGYFDGDGCVYFRQHWKKDRNKLKWVFQVRFTSGSREFLEGLRNTLKLYTKGGYLTKKERGYELVFSHHDGAALFNAMYDNVSSGIFLERKYKIFRKAVTTLKL